MVSAVRALQQPRTRSSPIKQQWQKETVQDQDHIEGLPADGWLGKGGGGDMGQDRRDTDRYIIYVSFIFEKVIGVLDV